MEKEVIDVGLFTETDLLKEQAFGLTKKKAGKKVSRKKGKKKNGKKKGK